MESQQLKQSSLETHKQKTILASAGQMSLDKLQPQQKNMGSSRRQFENKILQEINNDDQFMQLPNITTTYLPLPHSQQTPPVQNSRPKKQQTKRVLQVDQSEYENVSQRIKQSSQAVLTNLSRKRSEKVKKLKLEAEEDLVGIEEIIGDIQKFMEQSLTNSKIKTNFKKDTQINHHSAKRHFQSKGIHKFDQNDSLNKLQQMLLHYQINDATPEILEKPIEVNLKDSTSHRRTKHEERMNKFKQFNEVAKTISNTVDNEKPAISAIENKIGEKAIEKREPVKKKQSDFGLQNIEIIEIDWFKLPLFLAPLTREGGELALKMKDYPDDQSFWIAINESLPNENEYKTYSIFNSSSDAGIKKTKTLMSQEQFRERWAEEWSYDIEEEEHKQLLCQFDFQWYRTLIQVTYNHSIEEILIKNIKYDIEKLRTNLQIINGGADNDKNIKSTFSLPHLAARNKLVYIETLLNSLAKNKASRTNSKALFIAAIPNIAHAQSQQIFDDLKENLKEIFEGGIYASDSSGPSMGVAITKQQAAECDVRKEEGGRIQLGSVQLLINEAESGKGGDRIYLNRTKSKNSFIKLRVLQAGEEGMDLQVGEELYIGRRYHILLD